MVVGDSPMFTARTSGTLTMCGRYSIVSNFEAVRRLFGVNPSVPNWWRPRYNVAPTDEARVVRLPGQRARAGTVTMGPGALLGEGYEDWVQHDQRPSRDGGHRG